MAEENKDRTESAKRRPLTGPIDPRTGEFLEGRIETEGVQGGQIHRDANWRRRFKWSDADPAKK